MVLVTAKGPLGECYEELDISAANWLWSNVF